MKKFANNRLIFHSSLRHKSDKLLNRHCALLARNHILYGELAALHLALAHHHYVGDGVVVGKGHLLLHLHAIGVELGSDACSAELGHEGKAVGGLGSAEVDKHHLCAACCTLGIEVELVEHVVDAVGTEGDAYARHAGHAEDTRQVIVTATTRDTAYLHVECLDLEDGTGVVVERM